MTDPTPNLPADLAVRQLVPQVLGILGRRGADFATAEDAVQEAMIEAVQRWPADPPDDPRAWLVTVAWRKYLDTVRSEASRRRREEQVDREPAQGDTEFADDTLQLLFLCCHPDLSPASSIALTLRAVGGLTTAQIADAYLISESTMAQRISRAKRTIAGRRLTEHGSLGTVLHVLYLIFNEGHSGEIDLAAEAIRLTRQLVTLSDDPEVAGLYALMLLHHSRRASRWTSDGALVPLAKQDRSHWDTASIEEGVTVLQHALAVDRLGEYQIQAAIAALHADAASADETDWPQILEWYDELAARTDSPVVALNRAVAVGEVDGPLAGLRALAAVPGDVPRHTAAKAYLNERAGNTRDAADLYAEAARLASSAAERDHLTLQAVRLRNG